MLGYLGLPDPACWAVPNDLNRLLGIVKLARCLGVEEMLVHVGSVMEMSAESLRMETGPLRNKLRCQLRCVYMCALQA